MGIPFVIVYKVSKLTYRLAKLLVRGVKYIGMVNVLAGKMVVQERLQDELVPETLCSDLESIWSGKKRSQTIADLAEVANSLGEPDSTKRIAEWMKERFGVADEG